MTAKIISGDCREVMAGMDADSVDAIVTDPPYHLTTGKRGGSGVASDNPNSPAGRARVTTGFMGKAWDGGDIAHDPALWVEALRVAKPGAHLLAFGGPRTFHRLACAIEDAGWEIRDCVMWVYGSGFPKSLDVSKAIDKAAGATRTHRLMPTKPGNLPEQAGPIALGATGMRDTSEPITAAARQWAGWGTALKPAWEPIIVARKPLAGTVAANVLKHGTGALNIDGCRIETSDGLSGGGYTPRANGNAWQEAGGMNAAGRCAQEPFVQPTGRWPANVIHDGSDEVVALFPQDAPGCSSPSSATPESIYRPAQVSYQKQGPIYPGSGSAARFFYTAKAARSDRDDGLAHREKKPLLWSSGEQSPGTFQSPNTDRAARNSHPTVKPTDLMQYLCRLVTPPDGTVLDPFAGSGSTGRAAILEGFNFIGIELDEDYAAIARDRIYAAAPLFAQEVA